MSEVDFCGVVIICITAAEIEVAEENKVTEFSGVRSMEGIETEERPDPGSQKTVFLSFPNIDKKIEIGRAHV